MPTLNRRPFFIKLWLIAAIFSSGLLLWLTPRFVGSFSIGCIGMILNLYVLFSLLEGIFQDETSKAGGYIFLLMGKFLGLGLGVFALVKLVHVDLLGLGLGFFLVAISATYATSSLQK